ncbi:MAG: helix-turn-helix transcriptional regulator [Candidatus Binatus sp.]
MSKIKDSAPRGAKHKSEPSATRQKGPSFGEVIRRRRREMNLTQDQVSARIKTSTPYVGHLESSKRHPSDSIVTRLAEVLGFDKRELFFLANPHTEALLTTAPESAEGSVSAWEQFRTNEQLRRIHNISNNEMEVLSHLSLLGEVESTRDLIYILNTVRHVVRK